MVRRSRESALRSVIEASFDAALDAGRWPELLRRLTDAGGGVGSLFVGVSFSEPERGFIVGSGLDDGINRRFMTVHQDNLWSRRLHRVPPGRAVDVQAGYSLAELQRTEFIGARAVTRRWTCWGERHRTCNAPRPPPCACAGTCARPTRCRWRSMQLPRPCS